MKSIIVVTSWWSNCLALTCLHRLLQFAPGRKLYVMQEGKSPLQRERFRSFLPKHVTEIFYPTRLLPDDGPAREYLAKQEFGRRNGVWFVDHDTFLLASAASWLDGADARLGASRICLCTRKPLPQSGITQPAYWLSPRKLPEGLPSFSPVPFSPKPFAGRPDLHRHNGKLTRPCKDTLVSVREKLEALRLVGTVSFDSVGEADDFLPPFPPHIHLGGLHLYTGPTHPAPRSPRPFLAWRRQVAMGFERFFRGCPPEWLAIEDPELLRRHRAVYRTLRTAQSECS